MDRLNAFDAQFVDAEDEDEQSRWRSRRSPCSRAPLRPTRSSVAAIAGRLPLVPRYRQKLRTVPLRIGPPVWVEDPHFDLRYHIRQTALPEPGGDGELGPLMARVMAQRLDRDHPLWEYWLVDGPRGGHWAADLQGPPLHGRRRLRHRPVPGDLRHVAGARRARPRTDGSPGPSRRAVELAAGGGARCRLLPLREARAIGAPSLHPADSVRQAADALRGMARLAASLLPAPARR